MILKKSSAVYSKADYLHLKVSEEYIETLPQTYSKNFSKYKVQTDIALVKNVLDYDWVFATNLKINNIAKCVRVYKRRWSIETMFRVHDEARIKTKSKNPVIRLFYFMMSMLFLLLWNLYMKIVAKDNSFLNERVSFGDTVLLDNFIYLLAPITKKTKQQQRGMIQDEQITAQGTKGLGFIRRAEYVLLCKKPI